MNYKYLTYKEDNIEHIPICCGIVDIEGNIIIPEQVRGA